MFIKYVVRKLKQKTACTLLYSGANAVNKIHTQLVRKDAINKTVTLNQIRII